MPDPVGSVFELVADYKGCRIERRRPGFEFTPVLLGKVASFIVEDTCGRTGVFAFMYPFFAEGRRLQVDEPELAEKALGVIRAEIDRGTATHREHKTYELDDGDWMAVDTPPWWIAVGE